MATECAVGALPNAGRIGAGILFMVLSISGCSETKDESTVKEAALPASPSASVTPTTRDSTLELKEHAQRVDSTRLDDLKYLSAATAYMRAWTSAGAALIDGALAAVSMERGALRAAVIGGRVLEGEGYVLYARERVSKKWRAFDDRITELHSLRLTTTRHFEKYLAVPTEARLKRALDSYEEEVGIATPLAIEIRAAMDG